MPPITRFFRRLLISLSISTGLLSYGALLFVGGSIPDRQRTSSTDSTTASAPTVGQLLGADRASELPSNSQIAGAESGFTDHTEPASPIAASPASTESQFAPWNSAISRSRSAGSVQAELAPSHLKGPVTIAFGGDIHFEAGLNQKLTDESTTMLNPIADMVSSADLVVANLETTVTERGEPSPGKAFLFRTSPGAFDALSSAGIDVVSIANNHGMDFGTVGLFDTLDAAKEKDFPVIGAGRDVGQALLPFATEINGQRIAVIGATQVLDTETQRHWTATDNKHGLASAKDVDPLIEAVSNARSNFDTVVVYLHWGVEGHACPSLDQLRLSDQLVEAGADIIVGSHSHRIQGGGFKRHAFVHYGLGNFVFYRYSGPTIESGVLTVTIDGRRIESYSWTPARLVDGVATATNSVADRNVWNRRRACTDLAPEITASE